MKDIADNLATSLADAAKSPRLFEFKVRVYYEDTDAGGVVFYVNYLKFLERARTEWLRTLDVNQSDLSAQLNRIFVVYSLSMRYMRPAKLDDTLTIISTITRVGRASVHFAQSVMRDGELLATGNIQICMVDTTKFKAVELPRQIHAKLIDIQEKLHK